MRPSPLKIGVIHANDTGLSIAVALAQHHEVVLYDPDSETVHQVNAGLSPVDDPTIRHYLEYKSLNLRATLYRHDALRDADLILITTPTTFIEWAKAVDTSALDAMVRSVQDINPQALTVIESTSPVGYTRARSLQSGHDNLIAAPAFVRPKRALKDRLYPSRFVVGERSDRAGATPSCCRAAPCCPTCRCCSPAAEKPKPSSCSACGAWSLAKKFLRPTSRATRGSTSSTPSTCSRGWTFPPCPGSTTRSPPPCLSGNRPMRPAAGRTPDRFETSLKL